MILLVITQQICMLASVLSQAQSKEAKRCLLSLHFRGRHVTANTDYSDSGGSTVMQYFTGSTPGKDSDSAMLSRDLRRRVGEALCSYTRPRSSEGKCSRSRARGGTQSTGFRGRWDRGCTTRPLQVSMRGSCWSLVSSVLPPALLTRADRQQELREKKGEREARARP